MESGTPPQKDGSLPHPAGSPTTNEMRWRSIQLNEMRRKILNLGLCIPAFTKPNDMTGHDPGDEDPSAWTR